MFVLDVEFVKTPQGTATPSLVGLYRPQQAVNDLFGGFLFQRAVGGSFKALPGSVNGKLRVVRSLPSHGELDFVHRVIEGSAEIMQSVSKSEKESIIDRLGTLDLEQIISAVNIVLDEDVVSISISEPFKNSVKVIDVLFGPLNL
jgi:hypothetical protein